MEKVLINTDKFNGRYVAMKNFDDKTIVGVGDDPEKALRDAESKGHENAVILYVPEKDTVHIYLLDSARALRYLTCQYVNIPFTQPGPAIFPGHTFPLE